MIKSEFTQSAPLAPPHYELLAHPLIHHPDEPPTLVNCLDILANTTDLVDLIGFINIDSDSERGGLSAEAAAGFYWLTHMLKYTLRYISSALNDLQANQDQHHEQLKQSAFIRALQAPDNTSKEQFNTALKAHLGISYNDIDVFICLLGFSLSDVEPLDHSDNTESADTSAAEHITPTITELPEEPETDLSTLVDKLFPQLFQLSDDLEKLLSAYYFSQQAIFALLSEGQQISEKELGGLIATEAWMNEEADIIQKKLDNIISWVLKHKPPSSDQAD